MHEQEHNRLDDFLRDRFNALRHPPSARVWTGIEQRINLPTPPPRGPRAWVVGLATTVGVVVGLLSGSQLHQFQSTAPTAPAPVMASRGALAPVITAPATVQSTQERVTNRPATRGAAATVVTRPIVVVSAPAPAAPAAAPALPEAAAPREVVPPVAAPPMVIATAAPAEPAGAFPVERTLPTTDLTDVVPTRSVALSLLAGALPERLTPPSLTNLISLEQTVLTTTGDTARATRERARAALVAELAELARLHRRTDSLLLTLSPTAGTALAQPDSVAPPRPKRAGRWSVALAFAPERNFFGLRAAATDTVTSLRRTHETGRAGYNATFTAAYELSNRLSVGAGVGLSTYGAELRLTDRRTQVGVRYDTTTQQTTNIFTSTNTTYSVRTDSIVQLSPLFNAIGQVVDYDTVWIVRPDTTFTTTLLTDTVRATTRTITPLITTNETVSTRTLRPDYRFLTVPLVVRYRLSPGASPGQPTGRWWADLTAGAQLQFFLGGSQLVSADAGRTWATQQVGARGGPFRPLSVAVTGALAFNYAFTSHLSMNLAPTLRWQAQSVYKASTGLRQQPTAAGVQIGARWTW